MEEPHTAKTLPCDSMKLQMPLGFLGEKSASVVSDKAASRALCMKTLKESVEWPDVV